MIFDSFILLKMFKSEYLVIVNLSASTNLKYQKHKGDFLKIPRPCFQWYSFYHFPCLKIKYHLKTLETLKVACLYCDGWTCENTTGDNLFLPLDLDENRVNFLGSWAPPLKFHTMAWIKTFCSKTLKHFRLWM